MSLLKKFYFLIFLVIILIGSYLYSKNRATTTRTACHDQPGSNPVIISLSNNSGSIGMELEIKGCNFAGFEGDKNAWIENNQGIRGILYGETGSTSDLINIILKSPLCQKDTSYSGMACSDYLTLSPGTYKIYVAPWGKESNRVDFKIK